MKKVIKYLIFLICFITIAGLGRVRAQVIPPDLMRRDTANQKDAENDDSDVDNNANDISTQLFAGDKNAIFDGKAQYTYVVKNPTNKNQVGTVSYQVLTETGAKLNHESFSVNISRKSSGSYTFQIPEYKPGFYKVNFMVNVTDYDDTTRRAFGIKPDNIRSDYAKPGDFDEFWKETKTELAEVRPDFKVTLLPDSAKDNRKVYLFEMKSFGGLTIRGYLTEPNTSNKHKKFAVLLGLPGYQVGLHPMYGTDNDLAIITLNVRGQGNSRDVIHTLRDEYIFYHIEDKNRYVMRGVIMDCVRAVDFIFSRPELDHDKIMVSGGSMGGFLAIATAALDKRVALCSAQNPILSDVFNLQGEVNWPLDDINRYIKTKPGLTLNKVLQNLSYFDTKNFASEVKCPTLIGMGLLDPIIPPNNVYVDYNNVTAKKHLIIFRDLGHEVGRVYKNYEGRWMRDTFGLF
ncbi:acetylxylan esterase [Mucilaginibacter sp.]